MISGLSFGLLGPLEVFLRETAVPINAAKQRVLLASLLVDINRVVPVDVLVARLWDTTPPRGARNALQNYVLRLRQRMREITGLPMIESRHEGYLLEADQNAVDLHRFGALVHDAKAVAADKPEQASRLARQALELWRGQPLLDVPSEPLRRELVPALVERRLAAVEVRIAADLRLGATRDLIGELRELTIAHPLREGLWAQLMLALHQAGRPAEALECYHRVAALLADELGVAPGPRLRELHHALLTNDLRWDAPPAGTHTIRWETTPPWAAEVPPSEPAGEPGTAGVGERNDLPRDLPDLVGRQSDLQAVLAALPANPSQAPATVVAIDGIAGAGKTAFALHAAHHLTARYPDAQLFCHLHGHTAGQPPADPAAALAVLLRAQGVPDSQIPVNLEERSGLWRAQLAGRRALVVLDDAAAAAQVRPLLPGGSGCLVLVTSRRRLTALDTAYTHTLDVLSPVAARELFIRIVEPHRTRPQPTYRPGAEVVAVREVVRRCGYLPLAVRLAAARLRDRPAWRVAHLAGRLRDGRQRLAELAAGDRSVAAELALSYERLAEPQQRLFRLLGLVPEESFDAHPVAALAGVAVPVVERLLEELVDVHLLGEPVPGRYRFPGLVRDYAVHHALPAEPEAGRRLAASRLLDFYLRAGLESYARMVGAVLDVNGARESQR